MPGLVAGTLLFFIPASGDYINAELLGTPNEYMIGNVIDSAFLVRLDYPQGAALSFLLMAAILAVVFVYLRRAGTGGGACERRRQRAGRWMRRPLGRWSSALLVLGYLSCRSPWWPRSPSTARPAGCRTTSTSSPWTTGGSPCATSDMCDAVVRSVADRLPRHRGRHRARHPDGVRPGPAPVPGPRAINLLIFLPMATPELVMGTSLLALFVSAGVPQGFWTIVIAHVMFCVSFVVVTVKARLAGMDRRLEEAAMDLYASEWQTFRRITLPLVLPGIVAAALLAFSL